MGASPEMAADFYRKAIKLNKRSEANAGLAKLLMRQGDGALRKGNFASAKSQFEEAQKLRIARKTRSQLKGKASIASFFAFKADFMPRFEAVKTAMVTEKVYDEASKAFVVEATADLSSLSKRDPEFQKKAQRLGLVAVTNRLAALSWRVAGKDRPENAFVSYSKATVDIVEQGMARKGSKSLYRFKVSVPEDAVFEKVQEIEAGKFRTLGDDKAAAPKAGDAPAPAGGKTAAPAPKAPAAPAAPAEKK
jgi:Ni,Fe-hydrogenase I large subunit